MKRKRKTWKKRVLESFAYQDKVTQILIFLWVGYTDKVWKSSDKISALWRYLFSTLQLLSVRLLDMCGQVEFQNCSLICLQFWRSNTKKMDLFVYLANICRKKTKQNINFTLGFLGMVFYFTWSDKVYFYAN